MKCDRSNDYHISPGINNDSFGLIRKEELDIKSIYLTPLYTLLFILSLYQYSWGEDISPRHTLVLDGTRSVYHLENYLDIFEDSEKKATIDDVRKPLYKNKFKPALGKPQNFGFNDKNYWVHLKIKNALPEESIWFLELEYPHMDIFNIYTSEDSGPYIKRTTGDIYKFSHREVSYRNFIYKIHLKKGSTQDVYMLFSGLCSKDLRLTLNSPKAFSEKVIEEKFLLGIYYGIIIVMSLYNLFLFFFTGSKSYLYYVLYISLYGLVQGAYNGIAYKYLWPNMPVWHNISLPFLIGLTTLAVGIFSRQFLAIRENAPLIDKAFKVFFALTGVVMIVAVAGTLLGFYLFAISFAMILMIFASLTFITAGIVVMAKGYRAARFYLIAWLTLLFGMILIASNKLGWLPSNLFTEYAIQIGSALEVTLLSIALADRINVMNEEKRQAQLGQLKAQEKYKILVENTNDMIFTLDEEWNFITANRRTSSRFRAEPDELKKMNFLDLLYQTDEMQVSKKMVQEKLSQFNKEQKFMSFTAEFNSSIKAEYFKMHVRLEYITVDGRSEILGKASPIEKDLLIKYFEYEKKRYSIGNFLTTAEDISFTMTNNLNKFIKTKEINLIRMALREILINAIEHCNLEITYEEKTEAMDNDNYFEFIAQRRQMNKYAGRRIQILYSISPKKVIYRITDDGKGFDHATFLNEAGLTANQNMHAHGRGLILIKNIFDKIQYNTRGNQVLLIKYFSQALTETEQQ